MDGQDVDHTSYTKSLGKDQWISRQLAYILFDPFIRSLMLQGHAE